VYKVIYNIYKMPNPVTVIAAFGRIEGIERVELA